MDRTLGDVIDQHLILSSILNLPADHEIRKWPVADVALVDWPVMQQLLNEELPVDDKPATKAKRLVAFNLLQHLLDQATIGAPPVVPHLRESDTPTRFKGVVNGVLSLTNGAVLSAAAVVDSSTQPFASMDLLQQYLEDRLGNLARLEIVTLDLSGNDLRNSDMPYIVTLVQALKCPVVKLRSNRLGMGVPTTDNNSPVHYLVSLAAEKYVRFLDIVNNYVSAVDWDPAYRQFTSNNETTWRKLVYLPLSWVSTHKWQSSICGEHTDAAMDCHNKFYWAGLTDPVFTRSDQLPELN
ncbi:hypothetical protein CAOG_07942 [Capsaspora owczarzaki ATCC 30864]|uniref:Uncharacterized protein n=1 Tax=Capsaspora owczarzaki (strain ATCC 30864) TaxID=595528 RepID=A0A0D2WXF2_CAPO3|nr:hypothetical protein CAOG_07942 [Capsaspora owczarzaki ATCC 30864]KJE97860.1 hypothetical protein CAOG_007942 [Capsaspora owczarzaki ATCC 30864]|eukprot:XP_004343030.1 hypothetical protein CAOG_07942 [Capsaspora owczarzaki ATCC 30864]